MARLATVGTGGRPHLVPITFALLGPDTIVFAIDHKPKRTAALARLANIARDPRVSVLADGYSEDWSSLWWVRADGSARVLEHGEAGWQEAVDALVARYPQYAERPPAGQVVVIDVERWSGWSAVRP